MQSPSEQLLYNSVRITGHRGAVPVQTGTGFFFDIPVANQIAPMLVANKHVIDGADHLHISVHVAKEGVREPSDKIENVIIELNEGGIARHPDPDVDFCAISIGQLSQPGFLGGKDAFIVSIRSDLIPSEEDWTNLDALEEVIMVGCPNGLYDQTNGLPIIRRGTTASHPAFKYTGKDEFMIDAACFPGSSGSPVFLFNQMGFYNKVRGGVDLGEIRVKLLGILYAGPTISQDGKIIITTNPGVQISSMMHLGSVIRSTRLHDLANEVSMRS